MPDSGVAIEPRAWAVDAAVEYVRERGRVSYDELREAGAGHAVAVARARGLLERERIGGALMVTWPGSGISMFDPDWAEKSWRAGRWRTGQGG
jgi:hypothetical protein